MKSVYYNNEWSLSTIRLSALVSDVQPYLTQQSTLDALDAMETGVQLAEVIAGLSSNNVDTSLIISVCKKKITLK
jgi:hypothetical protein